MREKRLTRDKLRENGIEMIHAREERFSLEDVFISIVEKTRSQKATADA